MKIAIIRGLSLNKFEMRNFEPLTQWFDITAYYTTNNVGNVSIINLPKKKLRLWECVFGCSVSKMMDYPLRLIGYREAMIGLVNELKSYDIVHTAETYNGYSYQAMKAKEKYGTKVVVTCWENIPFFCEFPNMRSYIKRKVRDNADLFIAVTQRAKDALIYEGVPESKISVIPFGVDLSIFNPQEKDEQYLEHFSLKKDDFVILSIGRFVWDKGFYDVIYAVKRLILDNDLNDISIKVIFIGAGNEENKMRQLIKKLNLEKVINVAGTIPYTEIPKIYNLADVFVLPSIPIRDWQEQFGMVFAEAMASGIPVVAGMSGSIPEVIGDAGILVQPNDPFSIYSEIKNLILDKSLREKYKQSGLKRVGIVFNPDNIADKMRIEYEKIQ